ncbi:MAG: isoprenylcysteine carboxylmethyltransferase family protein [Anaerolineales bacterium]|nr:isoprenylcysteine carboxylmethyltransferase family protein [Anaerolineales bacterium]
MKLFLLIYFLLFFGLAMILPTYRTWKSTGVNPYKLGSADNAHDYIGKNFRLVMLLLFAIVILYTFFPNIYSVLLPISFLTNNILIIIGTVLLLIALIWVLIAQSHMQKSWRIGIDEDVKTDLVQTGLFKISRNPIFLGMRIMLLGLFLIIPNAITLAILITGELLIQIQVRLEEEFLTRTHGNSYLVYQKQVRRWL